MKLIFIILSLIAFLIVSGMSVLFSIDKGQGQSIYDFTMNNIDGHPVLLENFKGKVILIVNVASKCGLTPQYKGLQEIYSKYKDRGFVILGFPANNFLRQEPGTDKTIKEFCNVNFNVEFPMFSKISVKGKKKHPLYEFLTSKKSNHNFPGKIRWNFEKFIFNKSGELIGRFHPKIKPTDPRITKVIETELELDKK